MIMRLSFAAQTILIDTHLPQRPSLASFPPGFEGALVDPPHRLSRQVPLRRHPSDGGILAIAGHGGGEATGVGVLALQEVDALRADTAAPAAEAVNLHDQPDLPCTPGLVGSRAPLRGASQSIVSERAVRYP
jgi:hypothetical protein